MTGGPAAERLHPREVAVGDVIQDPEGGGWITVTRIVSGSVTASDDSQRVSIPLWSFYGDERLDEAITLYSDDVEIARRT
jgi:hypothetical protein